MTDHAFQAHETWRDRDMCEYRLHDPNDENIGGICAMPRSAHPEEAHVLRIQIATALRERDEARHGLDEWCKAAMQERARVDAAESALAAARRECDFPESVKLIAAERKRQVEKEGWTRGHDDDHTDGELASAAACYALYEQRRPPDLWPWDAKWWKPGTDDIRRLVKAGALIAAEIERLQRLDALAAPAAAAGEEGK